MSSWDDALGRMQPHIEGAPRAGSPSMGAGPVPYAPGMTQYSPSTAPPRHSSSPATDLPVNAGGRPPESGGYQPQAQGQGGQQAIDPMTSVRYMQMIYDWFMNGRGRMHRQG